MRELKFRAWNGFNMETDGFAIKSTGEIHAACWASTSKSIIMQFTGLKDKNGVEIYEGDILKSDWVNNCIVEFGECDAGVQGSVCDVALLAFHIESSPLVTDEEYEVIGNIHENPELIK